MNYHSIRQLNMKFPFALKFGKSFISKHSKLGMKTYGLIAGYVYDFYNIIKFPFKYKTLIDNIALTH